VLLGKSTVSTKRGSENGKTVSVWPYRTNQELKSRAPSINPTNQPRNFCATRTMRAGLYLASARPSRLRRLVPAG
jgi:hypothetical protein